MVSSEVEISNLALARLGARSITSLTEDSTSARECNRVYAHARDSELRSHPWSFARAREQIAASSTAPVFGYARQFPLPDGCLRILTANGVDFSELPQDDIQIEGGNILTNLSAPLNLIYVQQVTDVSLFDSLFVELLVCRMAVDMCEKLTQSNTKEEKATSRYADARRQARRVNGFERGPQYAPIGSWENARY
jgi:hypothetical protein